MAIFNDIEALIAGFIDKHIIHIPDDTKASFVNEINTLAGAAIEAGAKGAAEGIIDKEKGSNG